MRAIIERYIKEFVADVDPRLDWVRAAVRAHGFLPLYFGWIAVIGIRPDESFVVWQHEDDSERMKPLENARWQRIALCDSREKYPELNAAASVG